MKKSYTGKRTSIALDPELTKRIGKVSKNSGMKISTYAQEALKSALDVDEMKQILSSYKKLQDSGQYQRIKRLEGEIPKLRNELQQSQENTKLMNEAWDKGLIDLTEHVKKDITKMAEDAVVNIIQTKKEIFDQLGYSEKEFEKKLDKAKIS